MKKALHILKTYFETGDVPTQQQFWDTFDSFHHKDEGNLITDKLINATGDVIFSFSDGETIVIEKFVEDISKPLAYIDGLVDALTAIGNDIAVLQSGKVNQETGKGLSEANFTQVEKEKLSSLVNYIPPSSEPIAFINGLQQVLDTLTQELALKVGQEDGKGLSSNDYTDDDKQKLAGLNPLAFASVIDQDGNEITATSQSDQLIFEGSVTIDPINKKIIIHTDTPITKTSELINDGADGTTPYLTAKAETIQKAGLNGNIAYPVNAVEIPEGAEIIEEESFQEKGITGLFLPTTLTTIGDSAFSDNLLVSVDLPNSVSSVGYSAFTFNQLTSVSWTTGSDTIPANCFDSNQNLVSISNVSHVTNIESGAFLNTSISPAPFLSVQIIGNAAFYGAIISGMISFPVTLIEIGSYAFFNTSITEVNLPQGISIGQNAFPPTTILNYY